MRLADLNLKPKMYAGGAAIEVAILRVIRHEQYNVHEVTNDIALLKLNNSVGFNRKYFLYLLIIIFCNIIHFLTLYKSLGVTKHLLITLL